MKMCGDATADNMLLAFFLIHCRCSVDVLQGDTVGRHSKDGAAGMTPYIVGGDRVDCDSPYLRDVGDKWIAIVNPNARSRGWIVL